MKAKLKGKIQSMQREELLEGGTAVHVIVEFEGTCDQGSLDARKVKMPAEIFVKEIIAEKLHYGQQLFVTLATNEDEA